MLGAAACERGWSTPPLQTDPHEATLTVAHRMAALALHMPQDPSASEDYVVPKAETVEWRKSINSKPRLLGQLSHERQLDESTIYVSARNRQPLPYAGCARPLSRENLVGGRFHPSRPQATHTGLWARSKAYQASSRKRPAATVFSTEPCFPEDREVVLRLSQYSNPCIEGT